MVQNVEFYSEDVILKRYFFITYHNNKNESFYILRCRYIVTTSLGDMVSNLNQAWNDVYDANSVDVSRQLK